MMSGSDQTKALSTFPANASNKCNGVKHMMPPAKGRAASKLSSRHNRRRKRRERDVDSKDKDGSASKKPRGKRHADRIPIPSFTPIIEEEYHDEGAVTGEEGSNNMLCAPEILKSSSPSSRACPSADRRSEEDTSKPTADACYNSSNQKIDHRSHGVKVADEPSTKKQKLSLHTKDESQTPEIQQRDNTDAVSDCAAITVGQAREHSHDSTRSTSGEAYQKRKEQPTTEISAKTGSSLPLTANDGPSSLCLHSAGGNSEQETVQRDREQEKTLNPKETNPDQEMAPLLNKLSATKAKSLQPSISGPLEVIEIVDDDSPATIDVNPAMPKAKKEQRPMKKSAAVKKVDSLDNKRKPKKPSNSKQTMKRKSPISISRSSSSDLDDELVKEVKTSKTSNNGGPTKRRKQITAKAKESKESKPSAGKKLCFACTSCKCSSRAGSSITPPKFSSLSGSDARQEQILVNRQQRIDRDISWKQGQRRDVTRELKKVRGNMQKKWEGQSSNSKDQRPRFLADADVSDELVCSSSKMSLEEIGRAQNRIFGKQKTHQPTLTQMIGGGNDDNDDDENDEMNVESNEATEDAPAGNSTTLDAQHGGKSSPNEAAHDEFLSFWGADPAPTNDSTQCTGSMHCLRQAIANFKKRKSTGGWAKSVASTLQIEDEEGLDALVELFDSSIDQNRPDGSVGCSQNSIDDGGGIIDDGNGDQTPSVKIVAEEIKTSVEDDPQKISAVERMCPNWKENVEFPLAQTDVKDVESALGNLEQSLTDLEDMKEKVLQAYLDRRTTLELYKKSCQAAIDRLKK